MLKPGCLPQLKTEKHPLDMEYLEVAYDLRRHSKSNFSQVMKQMSDFTEYSRKRECRLCF